MNLLNHLKDLIFHYSNYQGYLIHTPGISTFILMLLFLTNLILWRDVSVTNMAEIIL